MKLSFEKRQLAALVSLLMLPSIGSASVFGFLGNFDVINDTGTTAHGFEIELEGLHTSDILDTFAGDGGLSRGFATGRGFDPNTAVVRYGSPTVTEYQNGNIPVTVVRYTGLWDSINQAWDFGTPSGTFITPGDNCWTGGGVGYSASTPCDHFGVSTLSNPTKTKYSWLLETNTPGTLTNGVVSLPAPVWDVQPAPPPADPAQPAPPPVVGVKIQAPLPENNEQFGEAIWVKVFTTELENEVNLEDLIGGNPVIDAAKQHTEIEWQLLQYDPGNPESAQLESGYGAPVGANAASIIRRYEFFKYAGSYDLETHEALVGSDSNPLAAELGNFLGAQNAAANLQIAAPAVPVPSAFILMGSAILGFVANRRRKSMIG